MKKRIDSFWAAAGIVFILWVFSFRVFLFREAPLISDAVSFYDHLKFYIDNLSRGVYPLWDPLWSNGSPNEFFLRRIGPFNPFLLLILIPYKIGIPYWIVFAAFITFYYFLGMVGFYKLAHEVLGDKKSAVLAFVLLSLSSLGTRVFDSYIMMFLTPTIWFFYFLLVFGRAVQRSDLAAGRFPLGGMVFCVMLLMTTYIPFYFILLVSSFLVFFVAIFFKETKTFIQNSFQFVLRYPAFSALCLAAVLISCVPGAMFFKHAGEGNFAMPLRHFDAQTQNVLNVKTDVATYWAIPEDLLFSLFYLEDLRLFDFAVFYIPIISLVFLCVGLFAPMNRKVVLMFGWMLFLFLMGSPYLVPLYGFLNEHIFFFKYFRNLHFFLWLGILPIFILFVVEELRLWTQMLENKSVNKTAALIFVVLIHVGLAAFLIYRSSFNYSTWLQIAGSFVIFVFYIVGRMRPKIFYILLFCVCLVQPIEAYHHLGRNMLKYLAISIYDQFSSKFQYSRGGKTILVIDPKDRPKEIAAGNTPLYFGTQWYSALWDNIDPNILKSYTFTKFILFDRVEGLKEDQNVFQVLEKSWAQQENVAYLPLEAMQKNNMMALNQNKNSKGSAFEALDKESRQLRVIFYDANTVKLDVQLPRPKFLVFNDCYYPGWMVFVDGKEDVLYRANLAFKGVFVPAGKHQIEFRYASSKRYAVEILLLIFYWSFFVYFLMLWLKERKHA